MYDLTQHGAISSVTVERRHDGLALAYCMNISEALDFVEACEDACILLDTETSEVIGESTGAGTWRIYL